MIKLEAVSIFIEKIKRYIPNILECLNGPAENRELDELETRTGKRIPKDFKKLYLAHNGENNKIFGVMAGFRWMNIESIVSNWQVLQHSAYDIISAKNELIQDGEFKKGWIPFAEDGGGSFLAMDLEPGSNGTYGQIITIDHDSSYSYVISESMQLFLEFIDNNFKNGNLNTQEDGDVILIEWPQSDLISNVINLHNAAIKYDDIPVSGFWENYYKQGIVDGSISTVRLAKTESIFIKKNVSDEFGEISLEILQHMINLKELIIHEALIKDFAPITNLHSLKKLIIGSASFQVEDLKHIIKLQELKELSLVNLSLNDIGCLENSKALKSLRLINVRSLDCGCLIRLKGLRKLKLENITCNDLSYLSYLTKITKLEIKEMNIPNLHFLKDLKKLTAFETDIQAEDEAGLSSVQEMQNLKELIYPLGDLQAINKCLKLQSIGVDASRLQALECLQGLGITNITIFNAVSKENAQSVIAALKKHCNLRSYGWQQTW